MKLLQIIQIKKFSLLIFGDVALSQFCCDAALSMFYGDISGQVTVNTQRCSIVSSVFYGDAEVSMLYCQCSMVTLT